MADSGSDLTKTSLINFPSVIGFNLETPIELAHGTAVAGVIGGDYNTFGVTVYTPNPVSNPSISYNSIKLLPALPYSLTPPTPSY
jgi:hypothetical protein